jgi:preprotein translocase subunit SecG
MGAAFGSGASGSLFGATGSSNFMSKSTGVAAAIFFSATLALSYFSAQGNSVSGGVMDKALPAAPAPVTGAGAIPTAPATAPSTAPVAPAAPAPTGPAGSIPK